LPAIRPTIKRLRPYQPCSVNFSIPMRWAARRSGNIGRVSRQHGKSISCPCSASSSNVPYVQDLPLFQSPDFVYMGQELLEGGTVVDTQIVAPKDNFDIRYTLISAGDKWMVTTNTVEQVSVVGNYGNQFNRVLSRMTPDDSSPGCGGSSATQVRKHRREDRNCNAERPPAHRRRPFWDSSLYWLFRSW
jgi:hypothetical protein